MYRPNTGLSVDADERCEEGINRKFAEILEKHGPMAPTDNRILQQFILLSTQERKVIMRAGSIKKFLQLSDMFQLNAAQDVLSLTLYEDEPEEAAPSESVISADAAPFNPVLSWGGGDTFIATPDTEELIGDDVSEELPCDSQSDSFQPSAGTSLSLAGKGHGLVKHSAHHMLSPDAQPFVFNNPLQGTTHVNGISRYSHQDFDYNKDTKYTPSATSRAKPDDGAGDASQMHSDMEDNHANDETTCETRSEEIHSSRTSNIQNQLSPNAKPFVIENKIITQSSDETVTKDVEPPTIKNVLSPKAKPFVIENKIITPPIDDTDTKDVETRNIQNILSPDAKPFVIENKAIPQSSTNETVTNDVETPDIQNTLSADAKPFVVASKNISRPSTHETVTKHIVSSEGEGLQWALSPDATPWGFAGLAAAGEGAGAVPVYPSEDWRHGQQWRQRNVSTGTVSDEEAEVEEEEREECEEGEREECEEKDAAVKLKEKLDLHGIVMEAPQPKLTKAARQEQAAREEEEKRRRASEEFQQRLLQRGISAGSDQVTEATKENMSPSQNTTNSTVSHSNNEVTTTTLYKETTALQTDTLTNIVSSSTDTPYSTGPVVSVHSNSVSNAGSYSASGASYTLPVVSTQTYGTSYAQAMYGGPVLVKAPAAVPVQIPQRTVQYYQGPAVQSTVLPHQVGVLPTGMQAPTLQQATVPIGKPPTLQQPTGLPPPSLQQSAAGPPPSLQPPTVLPPPTLQPTVVPQPALHPAVVPQPAIQAAGVAPGYVQRAMQPAGAAQGYLQPQVLQQPRVLQQPQVLQPPAVVQGYQYSQTVVKQQVYSATQPVRYAAPAAPVMATQPVAHAAAMYPAQPSSAYYTGHTLTANTAQPALQANQVPHQYQAAGQHMTHSQAAYAVQQTSQLHQTSQYQPNNAMHCINSYPFASQNHAPSQIHTVSQQQTSNQPQANQDQALDLVTYRQNSVGSLAYSELRNKSRTQDLEIALNEKEDMSCEPPVTCTTTVREAGESKYEGFGAGGHHGIKMQIPTANTHAAKASMGDNTDTVTAKSLLEPFPSHHESWAAGWDQSVASKIIAQTSPKSDSGEAKSTEAPESTEEYMKSLVDELLDNAMNAATCSPLSPHSSTVSSQLRCGPIKRKFSRTVSSDVGTTPLSTAEKKLNDMQTPAPICASNGSALGPILANNVSAPVPIGAIYGGATTPTTHGSKTVAESMEWSPPDVKPFQHMTQLGSMAQHWDELSHPLPVKQELKVKVEVENKSTNTSRPQFKNTRIQCEEPAKSVFDIAVNTEESMLDALPKQTRNRHMPVTKAAETMTSPPEIAAAHTQTGNTWKFFMKDRGCQTFNVSGLGSDGSRTLDEVLAGEAGTGGATETGTRGGGDDKQEKLHVMFLCAKVQLKLIYGALCEDVMTKLLQTDSVEKILSLKAEMGKLKESFQQENTNLQTWCGESIAQLTLGTPLEDIATPSCGLALLNPSSDTQYETVHLTSMLNGVIQYSDADLSKTVTACTRQHASQQTDPVAGEPLNGTAESTPGRADDGRLSRQMLNMSIEERPAEPARPSPVPSLPEQPARPSPANSLPGPFGMAEGGVHPLLRQMMANLVQINPAYAANPALLQSMAMQQMSMLMMSNPGMLSMASATAPYNQVPAPPEPSATAPYNQVPAPAPPEPSATPPPGMELLGPGQGEVTMENEEAFERRTRRRLSVTSESGSSLTSSTHMPSRANKVSKHSPPAADSNPQPSAFKPFTNISPEFKFGPTNESVEFGGSSMNDIVGSSVTVKRGTNPQPAAFKPATQISPDFKFGQSSQPVAFKGSSLNDIDESTTGPRRISPTNLTGRGRGRGSRQTLGEKTQQAQKYVPPALRARNQEKSMRENNPNLANIAHDKRVHIQTGVRSGAREKMPQTGVREVPESWEDEVDPNPEPFILRDHLSHTKPRLNNSQFSSSFNASANDFNYPSLHDSKNANSRSSTPDSGSQSNKYTFKPTTTKTERESNVTGLNRHKSGDNQGTKLRLPKQPLTMSQLQSTPFPPTMQQSSAFLASRSQPNPPVSYSQFLQQPMAQPSVTQPTAAPPPLTQPSSAQPPSARPPSAQPPAARPPVEQPLVSHPRPLMSVPVAGLNKPPGSVVTQPISQTRAESLPNKAAKQQANVSKASSAEDSFPSLNRVDKTKAQQTTRCSPDSAWGKGAKAMPNKTHENAEENGDAENRASPNLVSLGKVRVGAAMQMPEPSRPGREPRSNAGLDNIDSTPEKEDEWTTVSTKKNKNRERSGTRDKGGNRPRDNSAPRQNENRSRRSENNSPRWRENSGSRRSRENSGSRPRNRSGQRSAPAGGVTVTVDSAPKTSNYERLLRKAEAAYPKLNREEVRALIGRARSSLGTLGGKTMADIMARIEIEYRLEYLSGRPSQPGLAGPTVRSGVDAFTPSWVQQQAMRPDCHQRPYDVIDSDEDPEAETCAICLHRIRHGHGKALDCLHVFHQQCIKDWYKTERTCPCCRSHTLLSEDFPKLGA